MRRIQRTQGIENVLLCESPHEFDLMLACSSEEIKYVVSSCIIHVVIDDTDAVTSFVLS